MTSNTKIKDDLLNLDVKRLVKSYFRGRYSEEEIDAVLERIDLVFKKDLPPPPPPPPPPLPSIHKETIQDWVKRLFTYLLRNRLLTEWESERLHDLAYSKRTFGINHAMFVDRQSDTIISGHARYWQKPIGQYYVCSQWWKTSESLYEENIRRWLLRVLPDFQSRGLDRR